MNFCPLFKFGVALSTIRNAPVVVFVVDPLAKNFAINNFCIFIVHFYAFGPLPHLTRWHSISKLVLQINMKSFIYVCAGAKPKP